MSTYKAIATRDEAGYWNAVVPEVPGAFTFAKRLDQLPPRVAESIAAIQDLHDTAGIDVVVVPRLPEPIEDDIARVRQLRADAERTAAEAGDASRRVIRHLVEAEHLTVRDAGNLLDLSSQRVSQLLKPKTGARRLAALPHVPKREKPPPPKRGRQQTRRS